MTTEQRSDGEALTRLIFLSRRAPGLSDREIVDWIALYSMRRNRELDVSGCLWFGPTRFFQIMEGRASDVSRLFARISSDPRHRDIEVLLRAEVANRRFVRYAMRVIDGDEATTLASLIATHAQPDAGATAGAAGEDA